jgi:hypothetical protein
MILRNYHDFFEKHTMAYFNNDFVSKQGIGLEKYKQVMENKFLANYMIPRNIMNFKILKGFRNGLNTRFQMRLQTYGNGV